MALAVPLSRFTPQVDGGSAFFVRPSRRMTKPRNIALCILVVLVQLWLLVSWCFEPLNYSRTPFRQEQREAAATANQKNPSPEKLDAWRQELQLAREHVYGHRFTKASEYFAFCLIIDAVAIYLWRRHGVDGKAMA